MKTFKILGIILLLMVAGFFIWAAILPSSFVIDEHTYVKNTRQTVYESIIDFREWKHWSPWHDSTTKISYEGETHGVGAKMSWQNNDMRVGQMTIERCHPDSGVWVKLLALETGDSSYIQFKFKDYIDSMQVGIHYEGSGFKYMLGRFEGFIIKRAMVQSSQIGLQKLKTYVEDKPTSPELFGYEIEKLDVPEQTYLGLRDSVSTNELQFLLRELRQKVDVAIQQNEEMIDGAPVCFWERYDQGGQSLVRYCYPIKEGVTNTHGLETFHTPASTIIRTSIHGDYNNQMAAWVALRNYMQGKNFRISHFAFEEYAVGLPDEQDTAQWITYASYPVIETSDSTLYD